MLGVTPTHPMCLNQSKCLTLYKYKQTNTFQYKLYCAFNLHGWTMWRLTNFVPNFQKSIREHKKTIDENNARDLIDVYLREINLQRNNPDSTFTGK